ncbi:hypothetical protein DUI87_13645 [Hirundo rustica rustica]|uniref:Uncharacterized protein n=1 Tax=Hirundo rustica rustica TaxID=333673 RepID=A0A3M0K9K3_HIRRU|nr:hypothetical protein DUI87_13645 [Hirundo rustica rustica]
MKLIRVSPECCDKCLSTCLEFRLKIEGCAIRGYDIDFNITQVCTEYHKNQTKITPPVPRKAVITKMPAIPEVEEQITPVVTKIGPYAIKKTGVQKLIVNPKWSLKRVEMGVQVNASHVRPECAPFLRNSFMDWTTWLQKSMPPNFRNKRDLTGLLGTGLGVLNRIDSEVLLNKLTTIGSDLVKLQQPLQSSLLALGNNHWKLTKILPEWKTQRSEIMRDAQIRIVILLSSVIIVYKKLIKILEFVLGMFGLWFFRPTLRPSSSSMFWRFINNCTQFVRGGVGDEALQPLLSFFSFESVTSLLEKVQHLLNVKNTTFLVFHLVTFLYIVYSFSRMSHTLLNTVGQQIKAREQGNKSVTQAAANPTAIQAAAKPDSKAKTPAVAAIKKRKKHTNKTDRPVDDDSSEGSSMPPDTQSGVKPPDTQSEAEATDNTQSEAEPTDTKSEANQLAQDQESNQLAHDQEPNQLLQHQEPNQLLQEQEPDQLLQEQEILLSPFP